MSREADNYGLLGETPPSHASRSGALMKYLIGFVVVAMVYVGLVATSNSNDMVAVRGSAVSATTLPEVSLTDTELLSPDADEDVAEQEDDSLEDVADIRHRRMMRRMMRRDARKARKSARKTGKKRSRRRRQKKASAAQLDDEDLELASTEDNDAEDDADLELVSTEDNADDEEEDNSLVEQEDLAFFAERNKHNFWR